MKAFPTRLKNIREEMKKKDPRWTQSFVADKVGVARTTYTAYESGSKTPPLETVSKLADIFETSTDYLIGKTETRDLAIRKEIDDPLTNLMFDGWDEMDEETRREALDYIEYLKEKKKKK